MRVGTLRLLALLGLVGLLGLFTGNRGFFGFFGFFAFATFALQSDELLERNAARAGLNAFVVGLVGLQVAIVAVSLAKTLEVAAGCIAAVFAAVLITFIVSVNVYEKRADPE